VENNNESKFRKIGFTVSFFVLLAILIISFYMARDLIRGPHLLKVNFNNVGTLILQEPVSMDGVEVGRVHKIEYTPTHALVTLEFYRRIEIPKDSKIINFNHSLMGSRMIFIYRSKSSQNMDFTVVQKGHFEEGIAEMLHKTELILNMVEEFKNFALRYYQGNDSTTSFVEIFEKKIMSSIMNYRKSLINVLEMEKYIVDRIKKIEEITKNFRSITKITGKNVRMVTEESDIYMAKIDSLLLDVNDMVLQAEKLIVFITKGENVVHDIIYKRALFEKIEALNRSLNNVVLILQAEGITEIINFWKNVHILGTNPTKKNNQE